MLVDDYIIKLARPTAADFISLRANVGWQSGSIAMVEMSLNNSLFHITVYEQKKLVGMGRVVGDGAMYFYVQDVVVDPQSQTLGIGALLMDKIEAFLSVVAKEGATIALLAAKDKEAFYRRYHYIERPNRSLGKGMCKFI
ncbi:MAG: GNAT family N-acetyltransferase [Litorilituus sp.]|nr:GNAT family N-acetyltransferase [Litorilituus sp.]